MIVLDNATETAMLDHARAAFPHEACGLLLPDGYLACTNIAEDTTKDFAIADEVYAANSTRLLAVFHSHPGGMVDYNGRSIYRHGAKYPTYSDMSHQEASDVPWLVAAMHMRTVIEYFQFGAGFYDIPDYHGRRFRPGVTDCYALVRDYYHKELQIELPYWPRDDMWWKKGQNVITEGILAMGFFEIGVKEVLVHDCATGKIEGTVPNHCGVIIQDGQLLHHMSGHLSLSEPAARWMRQEPKFYRHPEVQRRLDAGEIK